MSIKKFNVVFSGKDFPEKEYPNTLSIVAPSADRAKEWAELQLKKWSLSSEKITTKVEEVK